MYFKIKNNNLTLLQSVFKCVKRKSCKYLEVHLSGLLLNIYLVLYNIIIILIGTVLWL